VASTIKIKRSNVAGKKPTTSEITTGELALNTKDQKLFSSNGTSVFELASAGALANTNSRIGLLNTNLTGTNTALRTLIAAKANDVGAANRIPYRNSSNVLTSSSGLQYDGTSIKVNGNLESTFQNGDEGGEFFLAKPITNSTITNGVTIDVFRNQLRIFENGGSNRGAYIDITAASGGVGSNLLAGGGSSGASWSALTSTNTALRTLISDRLQVANAASIYQTRAIERAALANTNSYIAAQATRITLVNTNLLGTNTAIRALDAQKLSVANATTLLAAKATWSGLTSTNTALRTLISDRLQVANAAAVYQTKAVERAALANTNSSIATQTSRITLVNTNLTGTNTALRTLISDRLQVANASTLYATKSNPTTSGLLAHTGRATISTNLAVSGNTILSGTLVANSSAGVAGYYLRSSGTGVYWSPVSGGGANGFSGILVGANVISADSTTDRLTFVAGSGITLAANPTTDTITISSSGTSANVVTKTLDSLKGTDTVVTSVNGVVVGGPTGITTGKAIAMAIVFGG
jgi:hypothetical protein